MIPVLVGTCWAPPKNNAGLNLFQNSDLGLILCMVLAKTATAAPIKKNHKTMLYLPPGPKICLPNNPQIKSVLNFVCTTLHVKLSLASAVQIPSMLSKNQYVTQTLKREAQPLASKITIIASFKSVLAELNKFVNVAVH